MADHKKKRGREIHLAIRAILYRDWDPFGLGNLAPQNEYDAYVGAVYRILASSRSEEDLVRLLRDEAIESPSSQEWLHSVALKLLALDVEL